MRAGLEIGQRILPIFGPPPIPSNDKLKRKLKRTLDLPTEQASEEIVNMFTRLFAAANPEEATLARAAVNKMKDWVRTPDGMRGEIIGFFKVQWQVKPGPHPKILRDSYPDILAKANALRPPCEEVLALARQHNKRPLEKIIEATLLLNPEWEPECAFILSNQGLFNAALQTAKIKRAIRTSSKSHLLADALACTYAGCPASPSYSIQVVGEARRLR